MVSSMAMNMTLIPLWGIRGAAIATASALIVDVIVNFILMYRYLHIQPYNFKYLGIIPSFVVAFVLTNVVHSQLDINFVLKIVLCGGIYFVIYSLCTYLFVTTSEERTYMRKLFLGK